MTKDRFRFRAWNDKVGFIHFAPDHCDGCEWWDFPDALERKEWVVEQCTGLKDKNGRLIYENDIVKITGDIMTIDPIYDNKLYVVNYSDLSFGFDMVGEEKGTLYCECWDYEVVGNIHENPALWEDK